MLETEGRDRLQLGSIENPAGRIVGSVDYDCPCAARDQRGQTIGIEAVLGRLERHEDGMGPAKYGVRAEVLIERLKDDHLVSRIDEREHDGGHRFCRTARHCDFPITLHVHAVPLLILGH